ncbi:hypothetical protein P7C73_g831, partial [Tremellales sp. Uapishka_1]
KSQSIKLLSSTLKEGPPVDFSTSSPAQHTPTSDKGRFGFAKSPGGGGLTPRTPTSTTPSLPDTNPLGNYAMELISEFLTREKREYMLKNKWAKSGRDTLSKELGEIESATCLGKGLANQASILLPVFLLLRRTFTLPPSPLPRNLTDPYLDILPAPPDPDEIPFREPTVGSTTATLYVNPRLDDDKAYEVLDELVENERELVGSEDDWVEYMTEVINNVQKRFPDGSYEAVFEQVKQHIANPPKLQPAQVLSPSANYQRQQSPAPAHRRAISAAVTPTPASRPQPSHLAIPPNSSIPKRQSHSRSASMPQRKSSYEYASDFDDTDSNSDSGAKPALSPRLPSMEKTKADTPPRLPPLQLLGLSDENHRLSASSTGIEDDLLSAVSDAGHRLSAASSGGGWWDVVSAVDEVPPENSVPWQSKASQPLQSLLPPLPPGAEAPNTSPPASLPSGMATEKRLPPAPRPLDFSRSSFPAPLSDREEIDLGSSAEEEIGKAFTMMDIPAGQPRPILNAQSSSYDKGTSSPTRVSFRGSPAGSPNQYGSSPQYASSPGRQLEASGSPIAISTMRLVPQPPSPAPVQSPPRSRQSPSTTPKTVSANLPSPIPIPAPKSKFGFGRSMSLAIRGKDKDKEREKEKENERIGREKEKEKENKGKRVLNDPGRWNKDLVAGIMGPPVEKK